MNLIVFRDGVSQQQINVIKMQEIPQIRAVLNSIEKNQGKKVNLIFICVNKRVGAKFYQ